MRGVTGTDTDSLLATAQRALESGRWAAAREAFEAVLGREESGAALFGLGIAQWWLGETESALRRWERAYAAFRRRPDPEQAVLAAFYLCLAYRMSLGNHAASRGWLGRAASLVEEFELGPAGRLGPGRSCLRRHRHRPPPARPSATPGRRGGSPARPATPTWSCAR